MASVSAQQDRRIPVMKRWGGKHAVITPADVIVQR